ncbi:LptF/LptG family permease [candidate division KSB1 bacterium]
MIRIIDKYFLKRYITTFSITTFAFLVIFIIVNIVENMSTFLDRQAALGSIYKYYVLSIPTFLVWVMPISMLMSSLFTMGSYVKYGELTALKSAGISLYRVILPVLLFALLISVFAFWFGEIIATENEREKNILWSSEIKKNIQNFRYSQNKLVFQDSETRHVSIEHYNGNDKRGINVEITEQRENRIVSLISAKTIVPDGDDWILKDVKIRDFSTGKEEVTELKEHKITDFSFNESDLISFQIKPETMNYKELDEFIEKLKRNGNPYQDWLVDYYSKFAFPFANFIVVLLGLPLATRNWRGGITVSFGIGLFICFSYYVVMTIMNTFGYNEILPPHLAAWGSNILFVLLGAVILVFSKK